jgi:hypothetical protein
MMSWLPWSCTPQAMGCTCTYTSDSNTEYCCWPLSAPGACCVGAGQVLRDELQAIRAQAAVVNQHVITPWPVGALLLHRMRQLCKSTRSALVRHEVEAGCAS